MEVCSNSKPNMYLPLKSKATFIKVDSIWAFKIKCMFWGNKIYLRESKTKFNKYQLFYFYQIFWKETFEKFKLLKGLIGKL